MRCGGGGGQTGSKSVNMSLSCTHHLIAAFSRICRMSFFLSLFLYLSVSSTYTHIQTLYQPSHEKQFHSPWPEPPQHLQLHYSILALVRCAHMDTHNSAQWSATALVVALNAALHENGGNMQSVQVILPAVCAGQVEIQFTGHKERK